MNGKSMKCQTSNKQTKSQLNKKTAGSAENFCARNIFWKPEKKADFSLHFPPCRLV